jgi:membrane protease YdiL (CAAX protease family)
VGGIFLCYVYEKTGSILVSTLTHGMWNGILALLIYLSMGMP